MKPQQNKNWRDEFRERFSSLPLGKELLAFIANVESTAYAKGQEDTKIECDVAMSQLAKRCEEELKKYMVKQALKVKS